MDDRPLCGLKAFSTTITSEINDLPTNSPHGSDFGHELKTQDVHLIRRNVWHSNGTPRYICHTSRAIYWIIAAAFVRMEE